MNKNVLIATIAAIAIIALAIGATICAPVQIDDNGGAGFAHTEAYNSAHGLTGPGVSLPDGYTVVERTMPIDIETASSYTVIIKENITCSADRSEVCV